MIEMVQTLADRRPDRLPRRTTRDIGHHHFGLLLVDARCVFAQQMRGRRKVLHNGQRLVERKRFQLKQLAYEEIANAEVAHFRGASGELCEIENGNG